MRGSVQNGRSRDLLVSWPRLAGELQQLREAAGLTTRELADQLGVSQSKVTKLENARTVPSVEDVRAWATATNAPAEQAARLVELVERTHTEAVMLRAARRAGLPELQRQTAESERAAMTIRVYYPTIIPGLLQTPDYARLVVTAVHQDRPDVADAIAQRMQRQAILYGEGRHFEFVIGEAALRWCYGSAAVQLGQLDRIRSIAMLPAVLVGVLPFSRETPAWHSHGFTLFEDRADDGDPFVHVETLTASLNVTEPADVQAYRQALDRLRELAVYGEDARAFLAQLMDELSHRAR
jgi:transcriptional regulator with XRE-family HTH domain